MSSSKHLKKTMICAFLVTLLAVSIIAVQTLYSAPSKAQVKNYPYVGIAFAGNTTEQALIQIDRAKDYTNLFVYDTARNPLSRNQSAVYQICDYAVANGLSVILNLGISSPHENDTTEWFWEQPLADVKANFTERWGDKFLGIYNNDEPGGVQLDGDWKLWYTYFGERLARWNHSALNPLYQIYQKMLDAHNGTLPTDYNLEADFFVNEVLIKGDPGLQALNQADITAFTSDYALYWFDYLGGYDVLFAEMGWNASISQQIALIKGAARLQDKDWGAIVTWKYQGHPFLDDNPAQIYNQMVQAYQAGAKYIVIFDYSKDKETGNTDVAMTDEHYDMLQRFWNDTHNQTFEDLSQPEAALVLPADYGWGMRNPDDTIWGFWGTDEKTPQVAAVMGHLVAKYGASLDIVYEDPDFPVSKVGYKEIYYWNSTITEET